MPVAQTPWLVTTIRVRVATTGRALTSELVSAIVKATSWTVVETVAAWIMPGARTWRLATTTKERDVTMGHARTSRPELVIATATW